MRNPAVLQRQMPADALSRYMQQLGLEAAGEGYSDSQRAVGEGLIDGNNRIAGSLKFGASVYV